MVEPAEDLTGDDNFSTPSAANNNSFDLEAIIRAEGFISLSDLHRQAKPLEKAFEYANDNQLAVAYNGDWVHDYEIAKVANDNFGVDLPSVIVDNFYRSKLSKEEYNVLTGYEILATQFGSIEAYVNSVPEHHRVQAQKDAERIANHYESEFFQHKMKGLEELLQTEKKEEIQESARWIRALKEVMLDIQAYEFAQVANEHSNVSVLFNRGNHENANYVERIRQYLTNKNQIIDITKSKPVGIINSEGESIVIGANTHTLHIPKYVKEIQSPEDIDHDYSHMSIDERKAQQLAIGNVSQDEILSHKSKYQHDEDYMRLSGKDLDVLMLHGNLGVVQYMNGEQGQPVPWELGMGAVAVEGHREKGDNFYVIEGHVHSPFEGKNYLGVNLVRSIGNQARVFRKVQGNLEQELHQLDAPYSGGHTDLVGYEMYDLKKMVTLVYEQIKAAEEQAMRQYNIAA